MVPRVGWVVVFTDRDSRVIRDGAGPATCVGKLAGRPTRSSDGRGVFVPVWCERDDLEPATIWVSVRDVLHLHPPGVRVGH